MKKPAALVAAIAAPLVAVAVAAPANADQYDFISEIDRNGVFYVGTMSEMIRTGKLACSTLRQASNTSAVSLLGRWLTGDMGFSGTEAGIIVTAAAGTMCPDVIPILTAYADHLNQQENLA